MAVTNTIESASTITAVVTIRIPCGADGDLVTDARERLLQTVTVDDVLIDELHSIEPKLSATVVTVGVEFRWTTTVPQEEIRDRLAEVPGLESIQRIGYDRGLP